MTLSGWARLWIVASVIWWVAAGVWAAQNLGATQGYVYHESDPPPTPMTEEWISRHPPGLYSETDYPALGILVVIVLAPLAFGMVLLLGRWGWRRFRPVWK